MVARWFPQSVSTFGGDVDAIFFLIYYIVGFWFLLTEGLILYFIFRYRRSPGRPASRHAGDTPRQAAWVLVPALLVLGLDFGIDVPGSRVWNEIKGKPPPADLHLEVVATQYYWEFVYPGPDGEFGTADDQTLQHAMHVPAGKVVTLTLKSKDVVHSLFIPNLRLKQDIVPGREINVWFNVTEPGTYEIACSELCGFGHHKMRGLLIVHPADEYEQWVQTELAPHAGEAQW